LHKSEGYHSLEIGSCPNLTRCPGLLQLASKLRFRTFSSGFGAWPILSTPRNHILIILGQTRRWQRLCHYLILDVTAGIASMDKQPLPNVPPRKLGGLSDLAANYDVILCDVWGVLHDGIAAFPKAGDALRQFRQKGGKVILITNAPRPAPVIMRQLDGLGLVREAYDGLVSSGDVTIGLILERPGLSLFRIGPPGDNVVYDEAARLGGAPLAFVPAAEADYLVCTGLFDEKREKAEDYDALLTEPARRGVELICANPDIVVRIGPELVACAGAIAERYEALGGTVIQAGKPFPAIYERALALAGCAPTRRERVLIIGDAMHTDIAGAHRQGLDNIFITSGIHRAELHPGERGDLDAAALRQFLESSDGPPMALMPELIW